MLWQRLQPSLPPARTPMNEEEEEEKGKGKE